MKRLLVFLSLGLVLSCARVLDAQIAFNSESDGQMSLATLSSMPLSFAKNQGQWEEKAVFKAESGGATFYFCKDEIVYLFARNTDEPVEDYVFSGNDIPALTGKYDRPKYKKESLLIKAQFIGANPKAEIIGIDRLPHNNNYFLGNDPSRWRVDVPNYSSIIYKDIYPGIDLKYYGDGNSLKYDFIISPGADVSQIRIRYDGIEDLTVNADGDLQAETKFGPVFEKAPHIYQEIAGTELAVVGSYEVIEPGVFGFTVDSDYSHNHPMTIDPQLVYSTYLGGDSVDAVADIVVDSEGCLYGVGYTRSYNFPTENPYDDSLGSYADAMVFKLSATGDSLIFSTFLGGTYPWYAQDQGGGIVIDSGGYIYIIGKAESPDFPLVNPIDSIYEAIEIFISKLSPAGNALLFSTFLGGEYGDLPRAIGLDTQNNICILGLTGSVNFPVVNPYDGDFDAYNDVVVAVLSAPDYTLTYSTYLGGNNVDMPLDMATHNDDIFITGTTASTDFPLVNPLDSTINGEGEIFISKIAPYLGGISSLVYSTFVGGSEIDIAYAIEVDENEIAHVTGHTHSVDFPLVNPFDLIYEGESEAIVLKLSASGDSLLFSTYLGGDGSDSGREIALDDSGNEYIAINTTSTDFMTYDAYDDSYNGNMDVFLAKLSAFGNCLLFSSYFGTSSSEVVGALALDDNQNIYFAGTTDTTNFPISNPYDSTFNGSIDVFIAKMNLDQAGPYLSNISGTVSDDESNPIVNAYISLNGIDSPDITDMNGDYFFENICPRAYDVFVSHPHFCDTLVTDVNVGFDETVILDVVLTRSGFIMGAVTDSMLSPIPGVQVSVDGLELSDTTDINGGYYLDNLYSGSYDVSFYHYVYADTTVTGISVTSGDTTTANLVLERRLYDYLPGDVNMSVGNWPPGAWGNDLCYLAAYYRGMLPLYETPCRIDDYFAVADINGDCNLWGTDVDYYRNYLFGNEGYSISFCDDYPPAWLTADDLPETAPPDWPDCDASITENHNPDPPVADPQDPDIEIWIGTLDSSPIEAVVGERVNINVYIQTTAGVKGANLHIPLAVNDLYIDSLLSQSEGQILDILDSWDEKIFTEPCGSPPNVEGWSSQSFMGFADINPPYLSPYLNAESPVRMLTFVAKAVNDTLLIGQTIECLDIGAHFSGWPLFCGDSLGMSDDGYSISVNISPIHFLRTLHGYQYLPGDANMANGAWPPAVIGGDVTYLVTYFRGLSTNPPCLLNNFYCSADVNGDCQVIGSDVTRMVSYFRGLADIIPCPDYEPDWPSPENLPLDAPSGWPNCETLPMTSKTINGSPVK